MTRSYKLLLIKALPIEMKFLSSYSFKIGAKLIVDEPGFIGLMVDDLDIGYPEDPEALPPEGVESFPEILSIPTNDDLISKQFGILELYQWAQQLDQNLFQKVDLIKVPEDAPEDEQVTEAWLIKVE